MLARSDFEKLVAILSAHAAFASSGSRDKFLRGAFHGYARSADVLRQLELDGPSGLVASGVVDLLVRFGSVDRDTPALLVLVNVLLRETGEGEATDFLRGLARRVADRSSSAPPPRSPKAFKPTGTQLQTLHEALLDAFPQFSALEQMLRFGLNKNLHAIAGEGSLQQVVFALLTVAEAEGWILQLVDAARKSNPGNTALEAAVEELGL